MNSRHNNNESAINNIIYEISVINMLKIVTVIEMAYVQCAKEPCAVNL